MQFPLLESDRPAPLARACLLPTLAALTLAGGAGAAPADFADVELFTPPLLDAQGVELADLDGDGQPELLIAAAGSNTIGWVAGDAQAGYGPLQVLTSTAGGANFVRAADLDLDGDLDIIGGAYYDGTIHVWENLGGPVPTFGPEVIEGTGVVELNDLDVVDVTGDGYPEILSASSAFNRIAVLQNNGDGSFKHIKVLTGPNLNAHGVTALDVDADGLVDVVGLHPGGLNINWFKNLGGGAFAAGVDLASAGPGKGDIEAADVDGDGDQDLVRTGFGLAVIENLGAGSFAAPVTVTTTSMGRMQVGDFDGDGDVDVAAGGLFSGSARLFRNDGSGQFTQIAALLQANSAVELAGGHIDGDGVIDFVTAANGEDAPRVFLGIGPGIDGGYTQVDGPFATDDGALAVATGDLNEDGVPDVVVTSLIQGRANYYEGLGGGALAEPVPLVEGETGLEQVHLADMNGDGHLDVLLLRTDQAQLKLIYGNGTGAFSNANVALAKNGMTRVELGDVDGDGDLDAVVARSFQDEVSWYANNGNGTFGAATSVVSNFDMPERLHVRDVDGDGHVDVLVASNVVDGVQFFPNAGGGVFLGATAQLADFSEGARGIRTGDLDGDGLLDVVMAGRIFGLLHVARQVSPGVFAPKVEVFSDQVGSTDMTLADVTNDGELDIVLALGFPSELRVWPGVGDGSFGAFVKLATGPQDYSSVHAGDADGDGDVDVLFTSFGHDVAGVVRNDAAFDDCNGNGVADFADIAGGASSDFDGNGLPDDCVQPPLFAATTTIDAAAGGAQVLELDAGPAHAGELYVMAGSLSGTAPGTPLGSLTVPLNVDAYTNLILTTSVVPLAPKFGVLDGAGQATAVLTLGPGVAAGYVGQTAHHAFVTFGLGYTFASNAVPVTIE